MIQDIAGVVEATLHVGGEIICIRDDDTGIDLAGGTI
jgi:hypothetical protein